ncbi:MAG: zinc-ribbon domain-containing protein, partial [Gemmatimonadales bacterium]
MRCEASIGPFDPSICPIDWRTLTSAPCDEAPPVSLCAFCGRDNEPGAQFCMDCGKPLSKAAALERAARAVSGQVDAASGPPGSPRPSPISSAAGRPVRATAGAAEPA